MSCWQARPALSKPTHDLPAHNCQRRSDIAGYSPRIVKATNNRRPSTMLGLLPHCQIGLFSHCEFLSDPKYPKKSREPCGPQLSIFQLRQVVPTISPDHRSQACAARAQARHRHRGVAGEPDGAKTPADERHQRALAPPLPGSQPAARRDRLDSVHGAAAQVRGLRWPRALRPSRAQVAAGVAMQAARRDRCEGRRCRCDRH